MTRVWVVEEGYYDSMRVVGVYSTPELAMAAHPAPAPNDRYPDPAWRESTDGSWGTGDTYDWEALAANPWDIDAPPDAD